MLTRITLKIREVVHSKTQTKPTDSLILWASLSSPTKSNGICPGCVGNGETEEIRYRKFQELMLSPFLTLKTIKRVP